MLKFHTFELFKEWSSGVHPQYYLVSQEFHTQVFNDQVTGLKCQGVQYRVYSLDVLYLHHQYTIKESDVTCWIDMI